jgi:hypothetical protein
MGKNGVIFSDGTGQAGGFRFDEKRSNIYKLYRATRCGRTRQEIPEIRLLSTILASVRKRTGATSTAALCGGSSPGDRVRHHQKYHLSIAMPL